MTQAKAPVVRKGVTLSEETVRYLEDLVKAGTHGSDVIAVIRTLVEEGVRTAILQGFIEKRPNSN